ncbi:hypothetical protein SHIRM173S_10994 [Streptomyces hirsutus]
MTMCAIEPSTGREVPDPEVSGHGVSGHGDTGHEERTAAAGAPPPPGCVLSADGSYGARLAREGDSLFPERWTLDGPEPYAVPLRAGQPEEPGTEVQPMSDGRVLIRRLVDGRHAFSLLYPTGPGTGEVPLGAVACPDGGTRLRLLPPAPCGRRAYAVAVGPRSTALWLVAGGAFGPEHVAEIPGRCSGGVWLDRTGRMLSLDREAGGRTKAVVVDLERGGEVSPLLQIAEESDDRVLLADPDSGLLLIRSDAPSPGQGRLGWGVLGSTLPVRFPTCLRLSDCAVTPFAVQPGQALTPEGCAVALRVDGPLGSWVGVWRPAQRQAAPPPGTRRVVGRHRTVDGGGGAAPAVRHPGDAVRGGRAEPAGAETAVGARPGGGAEGEPEGLLREARTAFSGRGVHDSGRTGRTPSRPPATGASGTACNEVVAVGVAVWIRPLVSRLNSPGCRKDHVYGVSSFR